MIHDTAVIGKGAKIGPNTTVGAYALIEDGVEIGSGAKIRNHAVVRSGTIIGDEVVIDSFAVVGGEPQDMSFDWNEKSGVVVGCGTIIREHATVHRATVKNENTIIGQNCLLMACSHVAHDCVIGSGVILANCALLGGFVSAGNHCFIGGGASMHQRTRVGEYTILGGYSASSMDLPPYVISADRSSVVGLNLVGLRRGGFSKCAVEEIKKCFVEIYSTHGKYSERASALLNSGKFHSLEAKKFLEFFTTSSRGIAPLRTRHTRNRNQFPEFVSVAGCSI
ncbi:MAG: acyl-ACP--UDP-N-acetylglucosamine O-acyltransferase [Puniceicoccales bacterium]|jgi:UDP-N-acetylglucosamine acyltransferase|nr:acyl-ACP--UDP-N-acetylglucosamine O-acyltransferase [Puniceicoccales bacterium]